MNNIKKVNSGSEIDAIIKSQEKLILFIYYRNGDKKSFEAINNLKTVASLHNLTLFCFVDITDYRGESNVISKEDIKKIPIVIGFFKTTFLGSFEPLDSESIKKNVMELERKTFSANKKSPLDSQVDQHIVIQNKILESARHSNPDLYEKLSNDRELLGRMVKAHLQSINEGKMAAPEIPPQEAIEFPSLKNIKYMYHTFLMLQELGVIKVPQKKNEDEIVLSNGDRIIRLENGTYGLIKCKTNK